MVYWDHILVGSGWREFKSRLASIMKTASFSLADQEHVNLAQVVELVLENHQDTIHDLSIALEWSVKTVPNIVHVQLGYSSVCAWWVPRYMMEIHENWCLEVLLHFFSQLKEEQMGSVTQWWYCETCFRHFTRNELHCNVHIHLHWEPQNVKCASMLEGYVICNLCCRSHHTYICWHAMLTALGY